MFSFCLNQISLWVNDILKIYTRTQKDLYLNANIRTVCINDVSNSCQYFRSIYSLCFNQARCFLLLRCLNRVMGWVLYLFLQDFDTILWFSFLCTFTFYRPGPPRARFNPGGQHGGEEALCARRSLLHLDGWTISRLYGHVVNCLLPWLSSVYFLWIWVTNALYGAQPCPALIWRPGWAPWWRPSWLDPWAAPAPPFFSRWHL